MAGFTPLPPHFRHSSATFSESILSCNKTQDCSEAKSYQTAHEVVSSLPLQMLLYFNVFFFPFWWIAELLMLELKYNLLPGYYQFLTVTALITITLIEFLRLYLGYLGNLQERVPELAVFCLLSILIQLPVFLFLMTDEGLIILPLERAVNFLYLIFLSAEIMTAFFALKVMTSHLAMEFHHRQYEDKDGHQHIARNQVRHHSFSRSTHPIRWAKNVYV
ncbi:transmembrane protein 17B-like [Protopterus annectens]|uniref:transmembrane protein 17B-like n=1 Tax=Protopterus annectens TaxID=7888 RepID=UPI001CF9E94E|nr:transmembrane protein 17B-like [Protopterus annectens]